MKIEYTQTLKKSIKNQCKNIMNGSEKFKIKKKY